MTHPAPHYTRKRDRPREEKPSLFPIPRPDQATTRITLKTALEACESYQKTQGKHRNERKNRGEK
jgi:hypothetical protein